MGYKVKSTGIPYRVIEGPVIRMACEVTFTLTGTDEVIRTVIGEGVNTKDLTDTTLLADIRMKLKAAVVAECQRLDAEAVETTVMTNQKTLLQTALTSSGWWYALLIFCLLSLIPIKSWAGDLTPSWEALVRLTGAGGVSLAPTAGPPSYMGTIDCSGHYIVEIYVNWEETGDNPSGTAGVSLYANAGSGSTIGQIPFMVSEIAPADYSNQQVGGAVNRTTGMVGVTKYYLIENIPTVGIAIGKNSADADTFNVRYRRMKGAY